MQDKKCTANEADDQIIKEGKAEILILEKKVFYNPVQTFNRDLSIAVLSLFVKIRKEAKEVEGSKENRSNPKDANSKAKPQDKNEFKILEALSATGLRSVRYAKEIPGVTHIVANDIAEQAVESIKKNIRHNGVEEIVTTSHNDARTIMYQSMGNRFDAIDIDPYGCPSIFLDSAVQCISEGGLLLVTATDMAVLAGNSPETCYVKYGAVSLKSKACHEIALRILLQHIAAHAGRYGRYVQPLLSISADFYIRVFVRIFTSQKKCKENTSNLGMLYQCLGCESMTTQPLGLRKPNGGFQLPGGPPVDQLCQYCRHHRHRIGGPIWLGPLHDQSFVSQLLCSIDGMELETLKRIEGILNVIHEELDVPLYYTLDHLMSIVRCQTPPIVTFRSALLNAGFEVSYSHASKGSIKTNAPNHVIWDIVRAWEKEHPARRQKLAEKSPALVILTAESNTTVSFDPHPFGNPVSRQKRLVRFQQNPTANWGPGARSITRIDIGEAIPKQEKNQNKKSRKKLKDTAEIKGAEEMEPLETDEDINSKEPPAKRMKEEDC